MGERGRKGGGGHRHRDDHNMDRTNDHQATRCVKRAGGTDGWSLTVRYVWCGREVRTLTLFVEWADTTLTNRRSLVAVAVWYTPPLSRTPAHTHPHTPDHNHPPI